MNQKKQLSGYNLITMHLRSFLLGILWYGILAGSVLAGTDSLNVLIMDPTLSQSDEMMRIYLRHIEAKALKMRLEKYELLKTPEQVLAYQKAMREFCFEQLDLPLKQTRLNARIVGQKRYKDFRIEKILYESQPGFYVSAIIYLPLTEGPHPAVVVLSGDELMGKAAYQKVGIGLARNGMAALLPDPIGQGERRQVLNKNGKGKYKATTEHMITGIAPILLGRSIASYMIWDAIRAIDYLESRTDIDGSGFGLTGSSGGGNRTSYLMALDDRIKCAAPACFITTYLRKNNGKGPGDLEQNIHRQVAYGMDLPDYVLLRAPKPTLILSATRDFVPIEGAWEAYRQAKRIYTRLGFSERIDLVEADEKHGFSAHLRVGMIRWMRRWLMGIDDAVVEKECAVEMQESLFCSPKGQVLLMPGARSIFDLNVERAQQLVAERSCFLNESSPEEVRTRIREIAGIRPTGQLPKAEVQKKGVIARAGYTIEKLVLRWHDGIELPGLLFQPAKRSGETYLYLHGEGKSVDAGKNGPIEHLVQQGNVVLAVDLRGIGETSTTPWRYEDAHPFTGHDIAEYSVAYLLGKSFVGMRAEDVLITANFLAEREHKFVHVIAIGEVGPAALHAVALEPELFESLTLKNSLVSWKSVVETPITKRVLNNVVHSGLKFYDLSDLEALAGNGKVKLIQQVNAANEIINGRIKERRK